MSTLPVRRPSSPRHLTPATRRPRVAIAGLTALLVLVAGPLGPGLRAQQVVEIPPPPDTEERVVVDTLHGEVIRDPYRWLEDQEAPATRAWIERQNEHTDAVLSDLPGRDELRDLATRLLQVDVMSRPTEEAGRYFYSKREAGQDLSVLYWREGPDGRERVLVDPHPMSEDHTTSVGLMDVSEDGRLAAYGVREGGVDEVEVRIREVESGEDLLDVLPTARYAGLSFTPDGEGLYYSTIGGEDPRVYFHPLGADPADDEVVYGEGLTAEDIPFASVSDDGRWVLVHVIEGSSGPTSIFLKDLATDGPFVPVIEDGESRSFASFAGDRLVITTNLDAPNKRVVTAPVTDPSVERWETLVPERDSVVIDGVSPVGGRFFVSYMRNVQPRVAEYDASGDRVGEIDFATLGSVGGVSGEWDEPEAFFSFSSFHVPTRIYRMNVETGERHLWFETEVPIDPENMEVEQVWYDSEDGTRVPMFLVYRKGMERNGENPVFLTGYGGFNLSRTPGFSATAAAWVARGGIYALPNLRGGGEFGETWHRAGMLGNKQNVFDDFQSAARFLVDSGYTRPERLAIAGGSNGGLLVGAAITQRPDLFGAAVISYPLLDMLRYHEFMVARFWVPEYGSAEDPEQFEYLRDYSPYHNVEMGAEYPATLLITGDGDTRVAPLHARKMTALLQEAQAGDEPILLRYHTKAGHSGGQPVSEQIEDMVDTLSFVEWQLGVLGTGERPTS